MRVKIVTFNYSSSAPFSHNSELMGIGTFPKSVMHLNIQSTTYPESLLKLLIDDDLLDRGGLRSERLT